MRKEYKLLTAAHTLQQPLNRYYKLKVVFTYLIPVMPIAVITLFTVPVIDDMSEVGITLIALAVFGTYAAIMYAMLSAGSTSLG